MCLSVWSCTHLRPLGHLSDLVIQDCPLIGSIWLIWQAWMTRAEFVAGLSDQDWATRIVPKLNVALIIVIIIVHSIDTEFISAYCQRANWRNIALSRYIVVPSLDSWECYLIWMAISLLYFGSEVIQYLIILSNWSIMWLLFLKNQASLKLRPYSVMWQSALDKHCSVAVWVHAEDTRHDTLHAQSHTDTGATSLASLI